MNRRLTQSMRLPQEEVGEGTCQPSYLPCDWRRAVVVVAGSVIFVLYFIAKQKAVVVAVETTKVLRPGGETSRYCRRHNIISCRVN